MDDPMTFATEAEMRPIVARWLIDHGYLVKREFWMDQPIGPIDLLAAKIGRTKDAMRATYKRVLTFERELVAVELKLDNIREVLLQAARRMYVVEASYVALPLPRAHHLMDQREKWAQFLDLGVGVLGVTPTGVEELEGSYLPENMEPDRKRQERMIWTLWNWFRKVPECFENNGGTNPTEALRARQQDRRDARERRRAGA